MDDVDWILVLDVVRQVNTELTMPGALISSVFVICVTFLVWRFFSIPMRGRVRESEPWPEAPDVWGSLSNLIKRCATLTRARIQRVIG
jgi:hypothetical protein